MNAMGLESIGTPALWIGFLVFVLAMLALDLGVFHRKAHAVTMKEAGIWSAVWVGLASLFGAGVFAWFGPERGIEFATGYLIEKALAVDNIFVFVVIFGAFAVPAAYQHRVLFWGVLGALAMRAAFIFAGGALLARFHWVIYVFGGILVLTGLKLLRHQDSTYDPERSPAVRLMRRLVPMTNRYHGQSFLAREGGRLVATPLLMALVAVEFTDLVFAVDSIPAIFAVTKDPFIVFTSNIFAILGLRSMYFLLAGLVHRFRRLKLGLALILVFVGIKMAIVDLYKIPVAVSLGVVMTILAVSTLVSWLETRRPAGRAASAPAS